jgi:PPP family 3-phenylpropionic acid transporter
MIDMIGLGHFVELAVISGILIIIPLWLLPYESIAESKKKKLSVSLGREFYIIVTAVMFYFISFTFNNQFLNIKIESAGLSQSTAGNMWSLGVFVEVLVMFFSGRFMKVRSSVFWLSLAMMAGTIRVLLIGLTNDVGLLYVANSLHGIAFGLFHLSMMELINEQVPSENRLKAQSTYSAFAFGLGTIMGSIFSGITYDYFGVDTTFLIASLFSTAGIVLLFFRKYFC